MKKPKLLILQGIPASGKSTWARKQALAHPDQYIIVNRDSIRNMLGKYWVPKRESLVTEIEQQSVIAGLNAGYTVLLDATNLNPKALREWEHLAKDYSFDIEYKELKVSLRKALWRDWWRGIKGGRRVGTKVVRRFYKRYYVEPNK